jgi:nucleoside phosphorylase
MELKHTPGPWKVNTAGSAKRGQAFEITEIYVYAPHVQDDTAICADIIDPVTQKPSNANAHLIAAAPELLDALMQIADYAKEGVASTGPAGWMGSIARVAIAKATGAA